MTVNQESPSSIRLAVDITTAQQSRNVRFTLRKKRTYNDRSTNEAASANLSSFNSDFLSGLFADVAKANVLNELSIELPSPSPEQSPSSTTETCVDMNSYTHVVPDSTSSPRPVKKSRLSIQCSRASCMNLLSFQNRSSHANASGALSPKGIDEISSFESETKTKKHNSLAYQLESLQEESFQEKESASRSLTHASPSKNRKKIMKDAAACAFPNLPSTVSDSSCESNNVTSTGLTRERCLIQHGSAPENAAACASSCSKESFGWFVDLDDNDERNAEDSDLCVMSDTIPSPQDLAFQAPTAPKRPNNDVQEQMEQAYAADTIDSVLGDLF
eukprot:jgi/Psemu1/283531/fgenesh1_pg.29_\